MTYDELLQIADQAEIVTKEKALISSEGRIRGKRIAIKKGLTETQKACALSEELGHYYTTVGDILDSQDVCNRKQEYRARLWAYNALIGLEGIVKVAQAGCQNSYEVAEYLGVTEEFLQEALTCYKAKYGTGVQINNHWIIFEPALQVYYFQQVE